MTRQGGKATMFDVDVREVGTVVAVDARPRGRVQGGVEGGVEGAVEGAVEDGLGSAGRGLGAVRLDERVTDIPRGPALTLAPEATIATAIEVMRRRRRGAVVIVQNQRPIGVVTDRDILGHERTAMDDLRAFPVSSVMSPCPEPLCETDTVAAALRAMCARRQWHLPIVCSQGLMLGALDIADVSLWLRDRLTIMSVDACFGEAATG
jgi:CBS domain-containing protein